MIKNYNTITKRIVPVAQNAPLYYSLNLDGAAGCILLWIDICLRGQIVLSAGAASGTAVGENPGGLISNIQFDLSAQPGGLYRGGKVKNLTPRSILRGNVFDRGRFQDDLGGSNTIAGTAATTPLRLRLPLYFALPNIIKGIETGLRLDQFTQALLTINMSSVAAMRTGNDRTVDLTGAYFEIIEHRAYAPGYYPLGTLFEDDKFLQVQGANSRFVIDQQLSKTETYLDALLMTETTNRALADTILNRATMFTGIEQFSDLFADEIRMQNNDWITEVASTALTGMYWFDFLQDPQTLSRPLSNAVPFINMVLDLSNPGTDDIMLRTRRLAARLGNPPKKAA